MQIIYFKKKLDLLNYCKGFNTPFMRTHTQTGFITYTLPEQKIKIGFVEPLPKRYLFLFNKVKKEIINNFEKLYFKDYQQIIRVQRMGINANYLRYKHFENLYYWDIKSAYSNIAHRLNLLSTETFEQLNNAPKSIKLKVIGNIAKTQYINYYDNNSKLINNDVKYDNMGKLAFNFIEYQLFSLFVKPLMSNRLLSYYVDSVLTTNAENKDIDIINEITENYDFQFTYRKIENVIINNKLSHFFVLMNYFDEKKQKYKQKIHTFSDRYTFNHYDYMTL